MDLTKKQVSSFRQKIWRFYRQHGRDLPFRRTTDPYQITVSEIMLQQTQVDRVVPRFERWITRWPDWQSLAKASRRQLLQEWSGLGYNRRALYLGEMAQRIVAEFEGEVPSDPDQLRKLPGIGPYTSHAILIFAFNAPLVTVDTNIRRVIIHELDLSPEISDKQLYEIARQLLPRGRSREWHWALMDYSALKLPRAMVHIPPKTRQSRFQGSDRQIRGAIVRRLANQTSVRYATIADELTRSISDIRKVGQKMESEGLVVCRPHSIILCE